MFSVHCLEFMVHGLELRVQGLGFMVQGSGFRDLSQPADVLPRDFRDEVLDLGVHRGGREVLRALQHVSGSGFRIQDLGFRV